MAFLLNAWVDVYSQITFVYVDASSINNRESLINQLGIFKKADSLCFFFSNDNQPLMGSLKVDFMKCIKACSAIKPGLPMPFKELDTMNLLVSNIEDNLDLHFFLSRSSALSGFSRDMIDRFLLCNTWLNKNGLSDTINVIIHIQSTNKFTEDEFKNISKNGTYQIALF
jgi:hypothetical protein